MCVRARGWPPFLLRARPHILPLLSQPLFKRFTQTRWAASAQTLDAILFAVGQRLPEFSELHDCFREVRRRGGGGQPGHARSQACVHTPHHAPARACAHVDAHLCLGIRPSPDSGLRGFQAGGGLPGSG